MTMVIKTKTFHHGNLLVSLLYEDLGNIWHITITQHNTGKIYDIHGIFLKLEDATTVYERIKL